MTPLGKDALKRGPWIETFSWFGPTPTADSLSVYDWRMFGANGELVCSSHQGFTERNDAKEAALKAQELFSQITEVRSA